MDNKIGLGHARLSIIDLSSGVQPIHNEEQTIWIILNGEIYNYRELRKSLEAQGHRFYTNTDTEVIVHLFEEKGINCVRDLNGQFAFAVWDAKKQQLFLARDHFGICPLFYTEQNGYFLFASEIKSLLASRLLSSPTLNLRALDQIFTFWTTLPGETAFKGIYELKPGHAMTIGSRSQRTYEYWDIPYVSPGSYFQNTPQQLSDQIMALLMDATNLRLRADVPVGSYLSGGLDSSGITALIKCHFNDDVQTFGVRFQEKDFDEGDFQNEVVSHLNVDHHELLANNELIASTFPQVVWHCEKPILRTAPVPMFLLSAFVKRLGIKVVCTGEGADEVFGGYDIFREALVRQFISRQPESKWRPLLLEHLYPQIFKSNREKISFRQFMLHSSINLGDAFFSHAIRWSNTARIKQLFSDDLKAAIGDYSAVAELSDSLPSDFQRRDLLSKAQYLEDILFLSNYLLSSQGDRMAMANSVEIRPPYLDPRIADFMSHVSPRWKILGIDEKHILKRVFKHTLPQSITQRTKHPYRAPIQQVFSAHLKSDYAQDIFSEKKTRMIGLFDPAKVSNLLHKLMSGSSISETEGMALAGLASTHILYSKYIDDFQVPESASWKWDIYFDTRRGRNNSPDEQRPS